MPDLRDSHSDLMDTLDIIARADSNFMEAAFFEVYEELASENGDVIALDYTPYRGEGMKIDGYNYDGDGGVFTIAISRFFPDRVDVSKINTGDINKIYKGAEKFVKSAYDPNWVNSLEEQNDGFDVAYQLMTENKKINRIKFIIFSNAEFVGRIKELPTTEVNGKKHSYAILDLSRYCDIISSRSGYEPIEVDFRELGGEPIPFLNTSVKSADYKSYLLAIPATMLADIYFEYGARLLEQNVRTFLQARGDVNKSIIKTLKTEPEMFFAFNNGLTATAEDIVVDKRPDGSPGITSIKNLQIVNGGQTTACTLYARDKDNCDLEKAYVQMKLSVLPESEIAEIVPKISMSANTQNKVNKADFFANHPFHIRIQNFADTELPPPREDADILAGSKWFYERARGAYKDKTAYANDTERRRFETEFPKNQVIQKIDLAKYEMSFDCQPQSVSRGAQANFLKFAEKISELSEGQMDDINIEWFRRMIAKAIIFKRVDQLVAKADWYYGGGSKAPIITYSIAWLCHYLKTKLNAEIDLDQVWKRQGMTPELIKLFEKITLHISDQLQHTTPEHVKSVTQWAKREGCWDKIKDSEIRGGLLEGTLKKVIISAEESKMEKKDAKKKQKQTNEITIEIDLMKITRPKWEQIGEFCEQHRLVSSEAQQRALQKAVNTRFPTPVEAKLLSDLLKKVIREGFPTDGIPSSLW